MAETEYFTLGLEPMESLYLMQIEWKGTDRPMAERGQDVSSCRSLIGH
jgi:hypothetical protein